MAEEYRNFLKQSLDLEGNNIDDIGAIEIEDDILSLNKLGSLELDFEGNNISWNW